MTAVAHRPPVAEPAPFAAGTTAGRTPPTGSAALRRFGRWRVQQLLGRSTASMAWLADDPRTGHETVLHLPRTRPAATAAAEAQVREARRVARIEHPRIAAVLEVEMPDGWPCLAVDRRCGVPLEAWAAARPAATASERVALVLQALEGLAYAHDAGVVHGDLQPWHCFVDEHDQLRLAGFGLGLHADAGAAAAAAPSAAADRRATRDGAARDVLAVGLLLHGLLAGRPALDEPDLGAACNRLPPDGREAVQLPRKLPQPVPDALRAIVDRATAREPRQRYLNARTLLAALDGWRQTDSGEGGGPLAWLLDRVRAVGFLPASPEIGGRIERLLRSEHSRATAMAARVLPDLALTIELLRQVNSAQVQSAQAAGGEPVLALSRAIGLLGTDGVRRAAAALRAWPGVAAEAHVAPLSALVERVRRAGRLAQALRPSGYDGEVVYLIAVLQNLGRLLVQYHFADEAGQIRLLMRTAAQGGTAGDTGAAGVERSPHPPATPSEDDAAFAVLGVDCPSLGAAVAQQWGFAPALTAAMHRLDATRPVGAVEGDWALLRATASAANEAVDALTAVAEAGHGARAGAETQAALARVAQRYARALRLAPGELQQAVRASEVETDPEPQHA